MHTQDSRQADFEGEQNLTSAQITHLLYESSNRGDATTKRVPPQIDRLGKAFYMHQAAINFNVGFVYDFVPAIKDGVIVISQLVKKK